MLSFTENQKNTQGNVAVRRLLFSKRCPPVIDVFSVTWRGTRLGSPCVSSAGVRPRCSWAPDVGYGVGVARADRGLGAAAPLRHFPNEHEDRHGPFLLLLGIGGTR